MHRCKGEGRLPGNSYAASLRGELRLSSGLSRAQAARHRPPEPGLARYAPASRHEPARRGTRRARPLARCRAGVFLKVRPKRHLGR
jgi:hypothetical protein